jgi:hypothetical protein
MFSAATVLSGAAIARLSLNLPERAELLETLAGILLIGGFAAIGCALPVMI